jgi:hypothetical protein
MVVVVRQRNESGMPLHGRERRRGKDRRRGVTNETCER